MIMVYGVIKSLMFLQVIDSLVPGAGVEPAQPFPVEGF